jgi:hypothetical protein
MKKALFEATLKAQVKARDLLHKFNLEEETTYGFTRNDQDLDSLIDAIDYGLGGLTFDEYKRIMEERKAELAKEGTR